MPPAHPGHAFSPPGRLPGHTPCMSVCAPLRTGSSRDTGQMGPSRCSIALLTAVLCTSSAFVTALHAQQAKRRGALPVLPFVVQLHVPSTCMLQQCSLTARASAAPNAMQHGRRRPGVRRQLSSRWPLGLQYAVRAAHGPRQPPTSLMVSKHVVALTMLAAAALQWRQNSHIRCGAARPHDAAGPAALHAMYGRHAVVKGGTQSQPPGSQLACLWVVVVAARAGLESETKHLVLGSIGSDIGCTHWA